MSQPANMNTMQEEMLDMIVKYHQTAMDVVMEGLEKYAKETGKSPTNALQLAAVEGFVAAAGQIVGSMTVAMINGGHLPKHEAIDGGVGSICMFQKTLLNTFTNVLDKGKIEVDNMQKIIDKYEDSYKLAQKKKAN